jgi:hypothetical protein
MDIFKLLTVRIDKQLFSLGWLKIQLVKKYRHRKFKTGQTKIKTILISDHGPPITPHRNAWKRS